MKAATRWRGLVRARLAEMERLTPGRGAVGASFWNSRARWYAAATAGTATGDPFLGRVRSHVGHGTSVLDVGAGPGRLALALAPRAATVTAVDPSSAMLAILRRSARRAAITNVRCVEGRWEDVETPPADVVMCSYVLPLIAEAAAFLDKLDAAAGRRAFVGMNAVSADLIYDPLWRHFHGTPRRPAPTYLDLVAVLAELGIAADVEVREAPSRTRWKDVGVAVSNVRDTLLLDDTPAVRRELRALVAPWLVGPPGALRPPGVLRTTAIISWTPRAAL